MLLLSSHFSVPASLPSPHWVTQVPFGNSPVPFGLSYLELDQLQKELEKTVSDQNWSEPKNVMMETLMMEMDAKETALVRTLIATYWNNSYSLLIWSAVVRSNKKSYSSCKRRLLGSSTLPIKVSCLLQDFTHLLFGDLL